MRVGGDEGPDHNEGKSAANGAGEEKHAPTHAVNEEYCRQGKDLR